VSHGAPARVRGCPDVLRLLSRKLEGDVTPELCAKMEAHLASCPRCTALCASMKETLAMCGKLPVPDVPPRLRPAERGPDGAPRAP
jgi:RNA polymerase sigma-70 factor (ECF subfamily)